MKRKLILVVFASLFSVVFMGPGVSASDARSFNAGRIIDDAVFTNTGSMSVQDIQNFLNSKVACDTWGTKPSELGGGTRRDWMAAHGYYPPFRCVTDYRENPSTGANNYGTTTNPAGSLSTAELIYNYSRQFNINPQVLIVTLQKENGLITDEWPTLKQYREAMGFGCPDNVAPGAPACDPSYGSFSAQLYQAARHFRGYIDSPAGWYVPFTTGWNSVMWSPNQPTCGAGDVYIENRATVALYSYTPYQPNQAAKNAQYGYGDGCSAYGNRNFYLYFSDWFGAVYGAANITSSLRISSDFSNGIFVNMPVKAEFTIKNNSAQVQDLGTLAIGVRNSGNVNYDFGSQRVVLQPWQEYTYTATRTFSQEDKYSFKIINYRDGYGWSENYPSATNGALTSQTGLTVQAAPIISNSPKFDTVALHKGQVTNLRFTTSNPSVAYPVNLGYFGVAMTSPSGKNADLAFDTVNSLAPGQTYEYVKQFVPQETGRYYARISSTGDGGKTWSEGRFPLSSDGSLNKFEVSVKNDVTLTQGLTLSSSNPRAGDSVTGTFTIKNFSSSAVSVNKKICFIIRDQAYANNDLGCLDVGTLSAGQELTYSGTRAIGKAGQYKAYFSMFDGKYWYDNWSFDQETGTEPKTLSFTVAP